MLNQSDATDNQGLVWSDALGIWLPGFVVRGLTSADASVTITDNGDGTLDLAAAGGGGGGGGSAVIAYVAYEPASLATYATTSTAFVDADATNLAVTFTVPSNGKVIIRLTALAQIAPASGSNNWWALREGTTTIKQRQAINSQGGLRVTTVPFVVTGLTPGASKTYKWAHRVLSGTTSTFFAGGTTTDFAGAALMEVLSLP
jgi:hypothetical protein